MVSSPKLQKYIFFNLPLVVFGNADDYSTVEINGFFVFLTVLGKKIASSSFIR